MNRKQRIISCLSLILFFNITKINSDFYILEPTSYYDDYFNKTIPKQYETVPNNDLNNNSDIVVNGLGFINVKKQGEIIIKIDNLNVIEIRDSLF